MTAKASRLKRHLMAMRYVLRVVVPILLRTGKRPVMFSKYSGIGDIICTFPAVLKLKARHPGAPFIYNCEHSYRLLPQMAGVTKTITHFPEAGVLRHWYGWLFAAFYEFPSADELPNDFCKEYVVKEYAQAHGLEIESAHPKLEIAPGIRAKVMTVLGEAAKNSGPIILIQTGPTWAIREWPRESWELLVTELKRNGYSNVFQIGTDHHLSLGTATSNAIANATSLINCFTLEETAAAIAGSDLFIGIDSGLLHIAASMRTPCIGIFGPTSPQLRLPPGDVRNCIVSKAECQGCHHRVPRIHWETGCPHNIQCMKMIQPQDVLEVCLRLLQKPVSCGSGP